MKFFPTGLTGLFAKIAGGEIKSLFLYGPNRGLMTAIFNQLVKKFDFFILNVVQKEATASRLRLAANNSNFFKQKELLKIDYNLPGINEDLKEFLSTDDFTSLLCFIGKDSLPPSGIRKFFELSPSMAIIACYYDEKDAVLNKAGTWIAKHNKTVSQDALFYIRSVLKGERQLMKNELEKLINYTHDKGHISLEDAKDVLALDISASGDEMCIYFSQNQPELFLAEVKKLRLQDVNGVLIIRTILKYYINLFIVTSKVEDGQNLDSALKSLSPPIFFKYIAAFRQTSRKLSSRDTIRVINLLQQAEAAFKRKSNNFDFFGELFLPVHGYPI